MRPQTMCVCASLPTIATATAVVILQHPREHRHPFNTARLVALSLARARLCVAHGGFAEDMHCPVDVPPDAAVLFPHPQALDLATLGPAERPSTLVVLDGTWAQAKKLYRMNAWLAGLRHVRLFPSDKSNYRIRAEPQDDYLSTVEATIQALQLLEPDNAALRALLAAFDGMIDRQIAHVASLGRQHRLRRARQRVDRRLSPLLRDDNLLVCYGESAVVGGDCKLPRELLQWTAVRVTTGEVFEALVAPRDQFPSDLHLRQMGLCGERLAAAGDRSAAQAGFLAFAGRQPVLAAWTPSTLTTGESLLGDGVPTLRLKIPYTNLKGARAGYLEQALQQEGLAAAPLPVQGRAAQRLGNALAMARWLRAQAAAEDEV